MTERAEIERLTQRLAWSELESVVRRHTIAALTRGDVEIESAYCEGAHRLVRRELEMYAEMKELRDRLAEVLRG